MNMLTFPDRALASVACAKHIAERLSNEIDATGSATLLVSGGSTPDDAFSELSRTDLCWDKVTVGLVDERWVENTSDASNEALVRNRLLKNRAATADFATMKTDTQSPTTAQSAVNSTYTNTFSDPTVIMLGMGLDAHTASWFPGTKDLQDLFNNTSDYTAAIDASGAPVAGALTDRMTITPLVVSKAKSAVLLIFGQDKSEVLKQALSQGEMDAPIKGAIERLGANLTVFWAP